MIPWVVALTPGSPLAVDYDHTVTSCEREAQAMVWELARGLYNGCQSEELTTWYSMDMNIKPYELVRFQNVPGVPCPCGTARRAFADTEDFPGTIHVTEISADSQLHYDH